MNTKTNGKVIKKYFCVKIIHLIQNYLNFAKPIEWGTYLNLNLSDIFMEVEFTRRQIAS